MLKVRIDCRHYRGDRPCEHNRLCEGCGHYSPYRQRVLVIKLGAIGDVVRTTCLLPGLRDAYPEAQITWLTSSQAAPLLEENPAIDRLVVDTPESALPLLEEKFDLMCCLDKEPWPTFLATRVKAKKRRGVGYSPWGGPVPLSSESDYFFSLGLSDRLKFRENTRTYPELIYEAVGLPYRRQEYLLNVSRRGETVAEERLAAIGLDGRSEFVGLNTGGGEAFVNKGWTLEKWLSLIPELAARYDSPVVLLGGPRERDIHRMISERVGETAIDLGTDNPVEGFAALVSRCRLVISGDTLGMHLAIAFKVPVVALISSTCPQEIELYGRGEKIVTPLSCAPCYRRECDKENNCMEAITPEMVLKAVERTLPRRKP